MLSTRSHRRTAPSPDASRRENASNCAVTRAPRLATSTPLAAQPRTASLSSGRRRISSNFVLSAWSTLLKSCATPPVSRPIVSILWA